MNGYVVPSFATRGKIFFTFIISWRSSFSVKIGFIYFIKSKVDIVVLETGLGGRLDATNIVTPLVSVITSIDYDHTEVLGNTLKKIAFEKAGIIKKDVPVVCGNIKSSAIDEIKRVAKQKSSKIYIFNKDLH